MTLNFLLLIFIANSLWIWGIYELCSVDFLDEDHPEHGVDLNSKGLFWKVKEQSVIRLGWFASKPICVCPPCMASLHSTYFFWIAMYVTNNINQYSVLIYIAYAVCLVGFNRLVAVVTNR